MRKSDQIVGSVYRKIAIDIARNIINGQHTEGQRLFGRSVLSSHYNVSPETIRKAVYLLKDVGIVNVEKGSGIDIVSVSKAKEFIERYEEVQSLSVMKQEVITWAKRQESEISDVIEKIKTIAAATERMKAFNPFNHYEIEITEASPVLNKTVEEIKLWQNTGATLIGIKRSDDLILSPGPYATLMLNDIIYLIGTEQSYAMAKNFIE